MPYPVRDALRFALSVVAVALLAGPAFGQDPARTPLVYRLQEEEAPPTFVGNIAGDSGLNQRYPRLQYDFLPTSPDYKEFFSITDGVLTAQRTMDRDVICPQQADCRFNLDVRAQLLSENIFEIVPVVIELSDINDNAPTFPERQMELSLLESSAPGTSMRIAPADDPDSPRYGINRYELASPTSTFELQKTDNADGTTDIKLVLKEPLDRETTSSYQLQVIAFDADTPPKAGSVTVSIIVKDINDNHPVFDNKTYEAFVRENVPEYTTILQVRAVDTDAGVNGEVVYSFSARTETQQGQLFGIDENSGEIFNRKVLDHEEGDSYNLDVVASDRNPQDPLTAIAKVVVHVRDLNDHAPQIVVNNLQQDDSVEIAENSDVGTFVAHITVRDTDSGENGRFNCSLSDGEHFELQKIYKTEYKIVTRVVFDREVTREAQAILRCHDFGDPPQTSELRIRVVIKDINDHPPSFNKTVYSTTLAENNVPGAFVAIVNASDADDGNNAKLRYAIIGDVASRFFAIDVNTGNITARSSFDYERLKPEKLNTMEVLVQATDGGVPPRSASATLHVTIADEDDVPPQFSKSSYIFGVMENLESNAFVGVVEAIDPDTTPTNRFMFSLALDDSKDNNSDNAFRVDPKNGRIYTRKSLDREHHGVYHLVVMATSTGAPNQSNTTNVFVSVLDDNDNGPIVEFPTRLNNTVYISEEVPVGYVVARIRARDADSGNNSKLTYSITAGNERGRFAMNMYTGAVLVASGLREVADSERYFTLFIYMHDNGNPPRFAETQLNVVVNRTETELISNQNLTIVITIASISGIVMVVLIVAIVFIVVSQRRSARKKYNYMPRLADQKKAAEDTPQAQQQKEQQLMAEGGDPSGRVDNTINMAKLNHNKNKDTGSKDLEKHELKDTNKMHPGMKVPTSPYQVGYVEEIPGPKPWLLPSTQLQKGHTQMNGFLSANDKGDSDSACSADMSNATDSGHGSNEGDGSEQIGHYRPSSPTVWDPTMRPIHEGSDISPLPSPSKEKGLPTRALQPGVHRKLSNGSRRDSDRERPTRPLVAGPRPRPPAPPRRAPSHQSDPPHLETPHLVLQPDSGYHGNNLSRTGGGQWKGGANNGQQRDGFYYASHV